MSEPRTHSISTPARAARARKRSAQTATEPSAKTRHQPATVIGIATLNRDEMIAKAAYYRAQKRNFAPGHELQDWLAALAEIDALLIGDRTPDAHS